MSLGLNIKNSRIKNNLSQKQLAEKITQLANEEGFKDMKYGDTAISNWERGTSKPDADTIYLLCKILKVDANYMLDWEEKTTVFDIKEALQNVLTHSNLFEDKELTEENLDKILEFIKMNKDFIIKKK